MAQVIETRDAYVEDVVILAGTPNEYINHYRHPREVDVRCDCGALVTCSGFTTTCDQCGVDYNWNGDRLASRSQWGEETGESYDDIVRPYAPGEEDY
jgi:hypothetical protein